MKEKSKIVALRIPVSTYDIIVKQSIEWDMTISVLLREIVVNVFDTEKNSMKAYKRRGSDEHSTNSRKARH